jgi:ribosomal protein S18 acetylase RimI-like enzyme
MKGQVRLLTPEDAEAFKKIRLSSLVDDPLSWLSSLEEEKDLPTYAFSNKIKYATTPPIFGYYGYFNDGDLLAYAQLSSSFWNKKKHVVNIYDVCVTKEDRRKSIGSKLMTFIIKNVKKTPGMEQIHLWVTSQNSAAISFYEKLGFKKVASTKNTVKELNGSYQDEILYTLNIRSGS